MLGPPIFRGQSGARYRRAKASGTRPRNLPGLTVEAVAKLKKSLWQKLKDPDSSAEFQLLRHIHPVALPEAVLDKEWLILS